MKPELKNNITRTFYKVGFQLKKHSPAILVGAGVVGVVASTVLACRATLKAGAVIEEHNKQVDVIHNCMETGQCPTGEYTDKDGKKDLTIAYTQTGFKFVKLYGPAVLLGTASVVSILASHRILNQRNAALASAYAIVDTGFKNYRKNVKERFGDRVDYELKHNIKAQEIKTIEVDENGNQVEKTKTVDVVTQTDNLQYSDFAKIFDETNPNWTKDPEYNLMFLKGQQAYLNKRLQAKGYMFLNEVYKALGFDETKAGQVVGWTYDEKNPNGDNFIDFGIYDIHKAATRKFVNGLERSVILDFNVEGDILNAIKWAKA